MSEDFVPEGYRLNPDEKPTLKTIARLSGLAVPTVSRALNDAPDIRHSTKVRVREIAAEIGYVPNRAGVRLRTGRTNVISFVMSTMPDLTNHTGSLISSLAGGMKDTAYHLNVMPHLPDQDALAPVRYIVETRSADAIIFNQIKPDDERVRYLMDVGFPFVTHGRSKWCDGHAYYDFDHDVTGRLAVQTLAARGRKNLLLIAPPRDQSYTRHLIDGMTEAAKTAGLNAAVHPTACIHMPRAELTRQIQTALEDDRHIDGIICPSTTAAMASVTALETLGRKMGDDIDVFAKEAVPILDWFRPGILRVFEDVGAAGTFLARAAIHAIRAPDGPPLQFLETPRM